MTDHTANLPLPKSLTLRFSGASDFDRLSALFDPELTAKFDPDGFVEPRLKKVFAAAVNQGSIAYLEDENNVIRAFTVAYHCHLDPAHAHDQRHDYTEFGSSLTLIPGFRSTLPVIAALALKEQADYKPSGSIAAWIKASNVPSTKIYKDTLGWEQSADPRHSQELDVACWATVPDPSDPSGETPLKTIPVYPDAAWFECSGKTLATAARTLLDYRSSQNLANAKTGETISLDLSVLDAIGLSAERLHQLAIPALS